MIKKLTEIKDQYKTEIKQSWTMTLINKSISLLHKCLLKFIICSIFDNFWHFCYLKGFWNCFLLADSHLHSFTRVFVMFSCLNSCFYRLSSVFLSFSLLTQGQLQIFQEYQISCLSRDNLTIWSHFVKQTIYFYSRTRPLFMTSVLFFPFLGNAIVPDTKLNMHTLIVLCILPRWQQCAGLDVPCPPPPSSCLSST